MAAAVNRLLLLLATAIFYASALSCVEPIEQASLPPQETETVEIRFELNQASLEQLLEAAKEIDGLNARVARSIVEFREEHGFRRVEDLLSVPYVGETTFAKLKPYFYVRDGGD